MRTPPGRTLPLSLPRRLICDYLYFAKRVPSVPVERRMSLAGLVAAREAASPRPSWCSIFLKAYGFVCDAFPELRRAYLDWPWPRLYEHPVNVATIAVERAFEDENAVVFVHLKRPETHSLMELTDWLDYHKHVPVESDGALRRQFRLARLPGPLRRAVWALALRGWGRKRAHFFGTFGVSAYSGLGATSLHQLSALTSVLTYVVIGGDSEVDVRIVYDHRVMDGSTVARALAHLERVLTQEIVAELRYLEAVEVA
jgi:hypothetical protein